MESSREQFEKILSENGLKRTGARIKVLDILSSRDSATSQPYLEKIMGEDADRVTLYRILQAFEEKGIIHKVLDSQGTANYAICSQKCTEHKHHDEHLHFNCSKCMKVYCLDTLRIPSLKTPKGFKVEKISLIATGICASCREAIN
jgi:Fur family ferric uptake transcriptional regulator